MPSEISIEHGRTVFVVDLNGVATKSRVVEVTENGEKKIIIRPIKEQECSSSKGASHG